MLRKGGCSALNMFNVSDVHDVRYRIGIIHNTRKLSFPSIFMYVIDRHILLYLFYFSIGLLTS